MPNEGNLQGTAQLMVVSSFKRFQKVTDGGGRELVVPQATHFPPRASQLIPAKGNQGETGKVNDGCFSILQLSTTGTF